MATIPGATGDPFPAPAWTHNAWPDFKGWQLVYVGADMLLAWSPPDGKYELWQITRTPPIGLTPLVKRIWAGSLPGISTGHELVHLGGDRLLSWKKSEQRYRVWLINRDPAPIADPLGNGVPQTNGLWSSIDERHRLVSLGGDRVLVWEPGNGSFRIFRHDPAALGAADPLPGPPLAQGRWTGRDSSHELVYLGGDRVLDWVPDTGRFQVLAYDRTAAADPFAGEPHIAAGQWTSIRSGHQLVYLDGDRVVDFEPGNGSYHLWIYERAVTTIRRATVTVHLRILAEMPAGASFTVRQQADHARALFASYGFDLTFRIGKHADEDPTKIGPYLDLDFGRCDRNVGPSPDIARIHNDLRGGVPKDEIVVFFVRSIVGLEPANGCSTHPFEKPGAVVEANRSLNEDTLAHEIAHVLGLSHGGTSRMLMYRGARAYLPADFEGWEIEKMVKSPCAKTA